MKLSLEALEVRENPAGPVLDDPTLVPPPPANPPAPPPADPAPPVNPNQPHW